MARQVSFHLKECFNNFQCSTILASLTLPIWSGLRGFQVQGTFSYKIEESSMETRMSWLPPTDWENFWSSECSIIRGDQVVADWPNLRCVREAFVLEKENKLNNLCGSHPSLRHWETLQRKMICDRVNFIAKSSGMINPSIFRSHYLEFKWAEYSKIILNPLEEFLQ